MNGAQERTSENRAVTTAYPNVRSTCGPLKHKGYFASHPYLSGKVQAP